MFGRQRKGVQAREQHVQNPQRWAPLPPSSLRLELNPYPLSPEILELPPDCAMCLPSAQLLRTGGALVKQGWHQELRSTGPVLIQSPGAGTFDPALFRDQQHLSPQPSDHSVPAACTLLEESTDASGLGSVTCRQVWVGLDGWSPVLITHSVS